MQRVEDGGPAYEELLNMVCAAVQKTMAEDYSQKEKLAPGLDPFIHRDYISCVLKADAKNYIRAKDFVQTHSYFFLKEPDIVEPLAMEEWKITRATLAFLNVFENLTCHEGSWEHDSIGQAATQAIDMCTSNADTSLRKKEVWQVIRSILTGGQKGPSLIETMEILGSDVVLERINKAFKVGQGMVVEESSPC
jgi:glutamyl/glutaminyl-tRNA synthetase